MRHRAVAALPGSPTVSLRGWRAVHSTTPAGPDHNAATPGGWQTPFFTSRSFRGLAVCLAMTSWTMASSFSATDLLTVVMHELGHVIDLPDLDPLIYSEV